MGLKSGITYLLFAVLVLVCLSATVSAEEFSVPGEYSTVSSAVDAAGAGDVVVVETGVYRENIVVEAGVSIRGEGDDVVFESLVKDRPVILLNEVSNVSITGVTVRGSETGGVVIRNSSSVVVERNRFAKNLVGILVTDSANCVFKSNEVRSNVQDGMRLIRVNGSTVWNNKAMKNGWTGIKLRFSDGNVLEENLASRNAHGIILDQSGGNVVRRNRAEENDWNGIFVWGAKNNTLEGNVALKNRYGIVAERDEEGSFLDNITYEFGAVNSLVLIGFFTGIIAFMTGWRIFRMDTSERKYSAALLHRALGFTVFVTFLAIVVIIFNSDAGWGRLLFLFGGVGVYLLKIVSVSAGRAEQYGPVLGSTLLLKWVIMLLLYVLNV